MSLATILPILNRIDALIKKIDELVVILKVEAPPDGVPVVVVVKQALNNRYKIFTQSLTAALVDHPIGIKDLKPTVPFCTYLTILGIGDGFTYKLNSKAGDVLTGVVGAVHEDFEIEEVYITCGAVTGNAIIYVEYRVD